MYEDLDWIGILLCLINAPSPVLLMMVVLRETSLVISDSDSKRTLLIILVTYVRTYVDGGVGIQYSILYNREYPHEVVSFCALRVARC